MSVPMPIPFDSFTLYAVVQELRPLLLDGQIQDVRQPLPTELLLGIRSQGRNYGLLLSADARFARVHLTADLKPNAPTPPAFCQMARKTLEGGWIRDLRQRDFDRIVELDVETRDGDTTTTVTLLAELMGKHSNLILVNAKGTILEAAKRVSRRVNRVRETLPGLPYQFPPAPQGKISPFAPQIADALADFVRAQPDAAPLVWEERLVQTFAGMSPFLAREIVFMLNVVEMTGSVGAWKQVWHETFGAAEKGKFQPTLVRDEKGHYQGAYPLTVHHLPSAWQHSAPNLNTSLDTAFTFLVARDAFESARTELRGRLEKELQRRAKRKQSLERTLQEAHRAEEYKQGGELLLANLWRIAPGEKSVTVQNYYDPALSDRTLTLDPKLSPQENAEAYFRRYQKARNSQEIALEQGLAVEAEIARLTEARDSVERAQTQTELQTRREELRNSGLLRAEEAQGAETEPSDFQGHKIRRAFTPEGYEILYGETATANDFLTTRIAAPNDLWLHVRAAPSAHVVIRTAGKPDSVPPAVLEAAAVLCARHSSQKHSSLVAVDVTLKKFVRKPRKAAPGSVQIQQEKTLHVSP